MDSENLRRDKSAAKSGLARLTPYLAIISLIVVALSYVTNAMDRMVFPILLPHIDKHLGFSLSQGGLLATIFTLGIGLAGVPTGLLLDRMSRKSVLLMGIAVYSIFTLLTAVASNFPDMFAYRTLSGVGEAMQNAALFAAVGAYFFANRALAIGALNFAYGIGGFIGPFFGARLAVSFGTWRAPFYMYGVIGLAFVAIVAIAIRKNFTEQAEVPGLAKSPQQQKELDSRVPANFFNRNVVFLGITAVAIGVAMYGFLGLYPTFLQEQLHFSLTTAGSIVSMFGLGALFGLPAGYLMDRVNAKFVLIGALLVGAVVGFLIFNGPTTVGWQYVLSFAEGAVASGFGFVGVYFGLQRSVRPSMIGRASGLFISCFYIPASLAGYLFAYLVGAVNWGGAGFWQLTIISLVGVVAMLFVDTRLLSGRRISLSH
jgi:MFS family permease